MMSLIEEIWAEVKCFNYACSLHEYILAAGPCQAGEGGAWIDGQMEGRLTAIPGITKAEASTPRKSSDVMLR
jgi:hypothetical protein